MLLIASRAIYGGTRRHVRRIFEGHLRPAQQYCCGIPVIGVHTNTARDVQIEADPGKMEPGADNAGKLVGIQRRAFRTAVAGNDQELRLAEARDRVGCMGILTQPARGLLQHLVAHVVPERGVDVMDIAQVDENQRKESRSLHRADQLFELALRHDAIGQPGQRVVIHMMRNMRLALRDVSLHRVEGCGQTAELIAP